VGFAIHQHESATGIHFLLLLYIFLMNTFFASSSLLSCSLCIIVSLQFILKNVESLIQDQWWTLFIQEVLPACFPRVISCLDSFDTKGWMKVKQSFHWFLERSSYLIENEVRLNQRVKYGRFSHFSLFLPHIGSLFWMYFEFFFSFLWREKCQVPNVKVTSLPT